MNGLDAQNQDRICHPRHQQVECIEEYRPLREVVLAHPAGGERHQRKPKQQEQIGPKDAAADPPCRVEEMMMVVPVDTDVNKAQHIAEEDGQQIAQVFQFHAMRDLEFQNHDGDDDGDHTIAECFQPALAQCCTPPGIPIRRIHREFAAGICSPGRPNNDLSAVPWEMPVPPHGTCQPSSTGGAHIRQARCSGSSGTSCTDRTCA